MDLDQYLEKMNTITEIIWILKPGGPGFIFLKIGEIKGKSVEYHCVAGVVWPGSNTLKFLLKSLQISQKQAILVYFGLNSAYFGLIWAIFRLIQANFN